MVQGACTRILCPPGQAHGPCQRHDAVGVYPSCIPATSQLSLLACCGAMCSRLCRPLSGLMTTSRMGTGAAPGISEGLCSACRCTCGECGAPAFFVFNGKTAWRELLVISGMRRKEAKDIKCGLQTLIPKARALQQVKELQRNGNIKTCITCGLQTIKPKGKQPGCLYILSS